LVAVLPCFIERDLAVLRGGLVIDHDQPAATAHLPYIVDRAGDVKVRALVMELHADEVLAPLVDLRMLERHRVEPVRNHDRVRSLRGAVDVELVLEHAIDQRVYQEWRARRSPQAPAVIEPETSWALDECFDLTAAHLERLDRVAIKQTCSFYDVRFFHDSFFSAKGRGNGSPISL